jgi:putative YhdH/YhfP family quinone oxidoreductase
VSRFRALTVEQRDHDVELGFHRWTTDDLLPGEVTIQVQYSSVNFKDALATSANGKVARRYPLVPGIDLAGTVIDSADARHRPGDAVLAHGYDLGVAHHGGYAEVARVPADWVVPLPSTLSARKAMAMGTAGFTAALSIMRLEHQGLAPGRGPVLVTGASGGVGSVAVALLAARGYQVVASSGSPEAHAYLRSLGATQILDRGETSAPTDRPLEKPRWAGAVDAVGGATLAYLVRSMAYGGSVAVSGNTGGVNVPTTVFPFILRGVNVLGIDSAQLPLGERITIWRRIGEDLLPPHLEQDITREISLDEVPASLREIAQGKVQGRLVVRVAS